MTDVNVGRQYYMAARLDAFREIRNFATSILYLLFVPSSDVAQSASTTSTGNREREREKKNAIRCRYVVTHSTVEQTSKDVKMLPVPSLRPSFGDEA